MTKEDILNLIEEEDVRFVRMQFTDILGNMRNLAITTSALDDALEGRCMFDGSLIEGFVGALEGDLYLRPNLDTFAIFPWRPHQGKVARFICDVYKPDGTRLENDPRYILKKVIKEASDIGFDTEICPENEFFLFNTDERGKVLLEPHDRAGYLDLAPLDNGENCRREICLTLEEMGYKIEASHHEKAPGQHEITFRHDDALTTADRLVTFRTVVKTIAKRNGLHATFMPKPIEGVPGSGMHLKMALKKNGKNIFQREGNLGGEAKRFIAGLLKYIPDMTCVLNPTVNSYKRFIPGFQAPCYISWSENNRSLLVRVPTVTNNTAPYVELRSPDSTSNPYLVIAACLRAGLMGIKNGEDLQSGVDVDIYKLSDKERESLGIKRLPISLNEAIAIGRQSDFLGELLGEGFKKRYLDAKQREYDDYRKTVNQWEIDNYLTQY